MFLKASRVLTQPGEGGATVGAGTGRGGPGGSWRPLAPRPSGAGRAWGAQRPRSVRRWAGTPPLPPTRCCPLLSCRPWPPFAGESQPVEASAGSLLTTRSCPRLSLGPLLSSVLGPESCPHWPLCRTPAAARGHGHPPASGAPASVPAPPEFCCSRVYLAGTHFLHFLLGSRNTL